MAASVREKGALGGAKMRKVAARQIPGVDNFPPIEFVLLDFALGIILYTTESPIGPMVGWRLKSYQGKD